MARRRPPQISDETWGRAIDAARKRRPEPSAEQEQDRGDSEDRISRYVRERDDARIGEAAARETLRQQCDQLSRAERELSAARAEAARLRGAGEAVCAADAACDVPWQYESERWAQIGALRTAAAGLRAALAPPSPLSAVAPECAACEAATCPEEAPDCDGCGGPDGPEDAGAERSEG